MDYTNKKALRLVFGDHTLGIHGSQESFHLLFSYTLGGPESMVIKGREWLYRPIKPALWRALTDNDKGNHFQEKSGNWLAADLFIRCTDVQVSRDGRDVKELYAPENNCYQDTQWANEVTVRYNYETITSPAAQIEVKYHILKTGVINVSACFYGQSGLPELPVFGLRMIMPKKAVGYRYEGLSGETYPDRKAGGIPGVYEIAGLPVTPYLVPQDCGMHMETKWLEIDQETSLKQSSISKQKVTLRMELNGLAFSCLPYTPFELENATHMEELPPARRTVLGIYGAVRGVGGIDSWGADVEEKYRIPADKNISFQFQICL